MNTQVEADIREKRYADVRERNRTSCPMCRNQDTYVEIRTWTKVNGQYVTIDPVSVRVCSHCKDKDGNGLGFIPKPK